MNYYKEIKTKIIDNETYERVKDYSKERHRVITYFEIGKLLNEAGGKYGDNIINEYSKKLVVEVSKKYNRRTLFRMKQFYKIFSNKKMSQVATQLSWSHYVELLPKLDVKDLVPDPILIKNKNNIEIITEKVLHNLILEDIPSFMKKLGNGYSFIDGEYKIKIGDTYHKIDLLLFNIKYNAYVVLELKVTEFKAEYISQIQKYMNYIDKNVKEISNNNTIGILICKRKNKFVIEYCSDERIVVREYVLV